MFSEKDIIFIKKYYPLYGSKYCSKILNKSSKSISKKASKLKIKLLPEAKSRIQKENRSKRKSKLFSKYKVNPNIFIKNLTKESAYILGLLWADGYVLSKKYIHSIKLECIKKDILIFYNIFQQTGNWGLLFRNRNNRQPQGLIHTSNKPLVTYLINNNYGPHNIKSADSILNNIPAHLHKYWYRGLIDGDGCWYVNKKRHAYQFSLAGSYKQDWTYFKSLLNKLKIKYSISRRVQLRKDASDTKSSIIRITNKPDLIKFGTFIYDGYIIDHIGLQRKYDKYILINSNS